MRIFNPFKWKLGDFNEKNIYKFKLILLKTIYFSILYFYIPVFCLPELKLRIKLNRIKQATYCNLSKSEIVHVKYILYERKGLQLQDHMTTIVAVANLGHYD